MGGTSTVTMVRCAVAKVLLPENNQSGLVSAFCILEPSLYFMVQHLSQVETKLETFTCFCSTIDSTYGSSTYALYIYPLCYTVFFPIIAGVARAGETTGKPPVSNQPT